MHSLGFKNLLGRSHKELDLLDSAAVAAFYERERPEYVFVAAASVRKPVAGPSGLSWVVVGAPPQDGWEPQL